jgi:hypothetical protein
MKSGPYGTVPSPLGCRCGSRSFGAGPRSRSTIAAGAVESPEVGTRPVNGGRHGLKQAFYRLSEARRHRNRRRSLQVTRPGQVRWDIHPNLSVWDTLRHRGSRLELVHKQRLLMRLFACGQLGNARHLGDAPAYEKHCAPASEPRITSQVIQSPTREEAEKNITRISTAFARTEEVAVRITRLYDFE